MISNMKNKFTFLLFVILALLVAFPKEITFATFPETSDFSEPIIVIITPCSRPQNLEKIKQSIDFSKIKRWYISYDCQDNKMEFVERFKNDPKIKELKCVRSSMSGNGPRNEALDEISKTEGKCSVCFIDDDTTVHPDFFKKDFKSDKVYTYDIFRNGAAAPGNQVSVGFIDSAQFLVDMDIVGDLRWINKYEADGVFIETIVEQNYDKWEYIPEVLANYNSLS